jgi:uncharacterized protein (TIGR02757 family)
MSLARSAISSAACPAPPRWQIAALDTLYRRYHRRDMIGNDPLATLYCYDDPADREVVALIAASLAYGNVKAIAGGIAQALTPMQPRPAAYLHRTRPREIQRDYRSFRYRVTSGQTLAGLLVGARALLGRYGSLGEAFAVQLRPDDQTILPGLGRFVDELTDAAGLPLDHLLAHPDRGSACKRLNLMLRWLVRCDAVDPGGWSGVSQAKLIVPLDTHMHQVALRLGWTTRRGATLTTAVQVTNALRGFAPDDPLKYDFALTRPGIRNELADELR